MFIDCQAKGFQMKFDNGWTVSVQWGTGNYCNNRDLDAEYSDTYHRHGDVCFWVPQESENAEIAAWDADGNWHKFKPDDEDYETSVDGWRGANSVLAFMNEIASK